MGTLLYELHLYLPYVSALVGAIVATPSTCTTTRYRSRKTISFSEAVFHLLMDRGIDVMVVTMRLVIALLVGCITGYSCGVIAQRTLSVVFPTLCYQL
jgi:hypothetical protein